MCGIEKHQVIVGIPGSTSLRIGGSEHPFYQVTSASPVPAGGTARSEVRDRHRRSRLRAPYPATIIFTTTAPGKSSIGGLRVSLHNFESEVGGARCLDRTCPPQFYSLRVEIVEESHAVPEQYGDEVDLHLVQ
jgi:hypothetical protein